MEHSRVDRNKNKKCAALNSVTENEYHTADDREDVLNVHILPARPINHEAEYADRGVPRSLSAQSLSSLCTGSSNTPPRKSPIISGPAINRDLKPSRRNTASAGTTWGKQPKQPHVALTERRPAPPPPGDQVSTCSHSRQRTASIAEFTSRIEGNAFGSSGRDAEKRSQQSLERVPSTFHHEWPQTKENQHVFVVMEKPQIYCKEEWYVGACNRADAEHALHLVNKDGAFLVRDCSLNTNSEPLVLTVYHEKRVYNVKIRFIESESKYALGTGQRSNDMFDSVADMIRFHTIFPILLVSGRNPSGGRCPDNCLLTCPVTKSDVDQLLQ